MQQKTRPEFFLSLIAFYRSSKKIVDKKFALIACLFLILSPRIFAESFYNSKDVLFLSFFNFSLFSYFSFLEKRSVYRALIHGLFTGLLIDIRILGILIPLLTVSYYIILSLNGNKRNFRVMPLLVYLFSACVFTFLCWPVLWEGPFYRFGQAYIEMKKYHWDASVLYLGKSIQANSLPWHYLPLWILITTPVMYTLLFGFGLVIYVINTFSSSVRNFFNSYHFNSILILFFAPVISIIVFKSVVYDGWRHIYFVYPLFILMAVYGLEKLFKLVENYNVLQTGLVILLTLNSVSLLCWMVKNHPHQNVYFNSLSTKLIKDIPDQFEQDYWGLSYKQGFEYLLKNNHNPKIKISVLNPPGEYNLLILPAL